MVINGGLAVSLGGQDESRVTGRRQRRFPAQTNSHSHHSVPDGVCWEVGVWTDVYVDQRGTTVCNLGTRVQRHRNERNKITPRRRTIGGGCVCVCVFADTHRKRFFFFLLFFDKQCFQTPPPSPQISERCHGP